MKTAFVASFPNLSASGLQRQWALEQCGVDVSVFNKHKYTSLLGRWAGYLAKILRRPRLMQNSALLEKELIAFCKEVKPDVIWFEWTKEIQPSVLHEIQNLDPKPFLISFQDDNPWGERKSDQWMWKDYFKVVPYFDLHLVKRQSDIENLKKLGAKNFRFWDHGIFSPIFHPPEKENTEKKYPVSFVATCMDNRGAFVEHLLNKGIELHIFGPLWKRRMGDLVRRFPHNFHEPVWGDEYADVIRQSYISLLTVSDSNYDEWTLRDYEVPGCATAPLVRKTPKHETMFTNGENAYIYNSAIDCAEIILDALAKPDSVIEVGKRAEQTFKDRKWVIESRMHELLQALADEKLINYQPVVTGKKIANKT
jgi:hypothetical protein